VDYLLGAPSAADSKSSVRTVQYDIDETNTYASPL